MKSFLISYFSEIISGLGAIGSLLGALFAWIQHSKAKSSADSARESESKLLEAIKNNEMSRDIQRIKTLVERLSKYAHKGQSIRSSGLNLSGDIQQVISFRNDFSSNSRYAREHSTKLAEINRVCATIDFKNATEDDRISSINEIIEFLNEIAVSIDEKVSNHG
ncbi:hypothetical protein [Gilvimarinus japonicus]|uniref:Uncharacterized protein n=1 Tax=Gilvimarinus japonicus TaxID=1796469 RepID=A0ABV7HSR1_9GAMM